jgi:hypothetical protein
MPIVRQYVENYLGRPAEGGIDPMECVCKGAAIQGGVIGGKIKKIVLVDVTPLSLGTEIQDGSTSVIIKRQTPIPITKSDDYTTVYDMYLITSAAIQNEKFVQIISTATYDTNYSTVSGEAKSQTWNNTNHYLLGTAKAPEGFTVIGGKTGTTYEAGYCLVLYSKNSAGQDIISIVYNADCALNLYYLMNELLYTFAEPK